MLLKSFYRSVLASRLQRSKIAGILSVHQICTGMWKRPAHNQCTVQVMEDVLGWLHHVPAHLVLQVVVYNMQKKSMLATRWPTIFGLLWKPENSYTLYDIMNCRQLPHQPFVNWKLWQHLFWLLWMARLTLFTAHARLCADAVLQTSVKDVGGVRAVWYICDTHFCCWRGILALWCCPLLPLQHFWLAIGQQFSTCAMLGG